MRYTTTDAPNKPLNAIQEGSLGDKMGIAVFELIDIKRAEGSIGPARSFKDYTVIVGSVPPGVILQEELPLLKKGDRSEERRLGLMLRSALSLFLLY